MKSICQKLLIGAPAEEVYNALTTRKGLAGWWTPDTTARVEVNSIARFPFRFPTGMVFTLEMKVTELKPSRLVKWNCVGGADEWLGTTISFRLDTGDKETLLKSHPEMVPQIEYQKSDKGTVVIFQHDDWKEYTPMFAECSFTWGAFLRSLKLLCETGEGKPWPNQYQ